MSDEAKTESVITLGMIEAFAAHFEIDLTNGTQYPGVIGSLRSLESGDGQWEPWMTEEQHGNLFAPLALARKNALDAKAGAAEAPVEPAA